MNTSYIQYTIDTNRGTIIRTKEGWEGKPGQAATIEVDSTITLEPGSDAYVQNIGTPGEAHLVFGVPQGQVGEQGIQGIPGRTSTIQVGQVTSGSSPSVVNVGTDTDAIFNFVLEKGETGQTGVGVPSGGTQGQILAKSSSTDYDTEWIDAPSGGNTPNGLIDTGTKICILADSDNYSVRINQGVPGSRPESEKTYNRIDWGDGSAPESVDISTHTYTNAGRYIITLYYNDASTYYNVKISSISHGSTTIYPVYVAPGLYCSFFGGQIRSGVIDWKYWNGINKAKVLEGTFFKTETTYDGTPKTIEFPEGITSFGSYCIWEGYERVILPSSTSSIGSQFIYSNPNSISKLICKAITPPTLGPNFYIGANCTILVPWSPDHSILNAYKAATNWSAFASQIYEGGF